MLRVVNYYNLRISKNFSDGSVIDESVLLREIESDKKNYVTVETVDTFDFKKIFPVKKTDVILIKSEIEEWTSEMDIQKDKELNFKWTKTQK